MAGRARCSGVLREEQGSREGVKESRRAYWGRQREGTREQRQRVSSLLLETTRPTCSEQ
jgi:hypothetical protein